MPQPRSGPRVHSVLATPLRVNAHAVGTLEAYAFERRAWTDQQIALLESLAAQTSISLQAAELRPSQLTLEVTESVLMNGIENAVTTLTALRQMGVTLSIDDFGTGYSSLSYLATLPIDALKIDRSFIDRMSRDGEGSEIVKAIFKLGQALSKQVYAEGIETPAQLALLQELGCEFGQGFLLSRPVGAESAGTFVASNDGVSAAA